MICYHCMAKIEPGADIETHQCPIDNPYWEDRTSPYCEECGMTKNGQGVDRCACNDISPRGAMNKNHELRVLQPDWQRVYEDKHSLLADFPDLVGVDLRTGWVHRNGDWALLISDDPGRDWWKVMVWNNRDPRTAFRMVADLPSIAGVINPGIVVGDTDHWNKEPNKDYLAKFFGHNQ